MPDKRAVSVWVALDDACLDNGCMWFGQGSHKLPIREHHPAAEGHHVLYCKGDEVKKELSTSNRQSRWYNNVNYIKTS